VFWWSFLVVLFGVWGSVFDGNGGELKNITQGALPTASTPRDFSQSRVLNYFVKVLDSYIVNVIIYQQ
jgi:hypothetical protein